jgi:hypothetical protein
MIRKHFDLVRIVERNRNVVVAVAVKVADRHVANRGLILLRKRETIGAALCVERKQVCHLRAVAAHKDVLAIAFAHARRRVVREYEPRRACRIIHKNGKESPSIERIPSTIASPEPGAHCTF